MNAVCMDMLSLQHRGGQKRGLGLKLSDNVFKNQKSKFCHPPSTYHATEDTQLVLAKQHLNSRM